MKKGALSLESLKSVFTQYIGATKRTYPPILVSMLLSTGANAAIIEYIYDAHISLVQGLDSIAVGDTVTARVMYDTENIEYTLIGDVFAYYYFDTDAFNIEVSVDNGSQVYTGGSNDGYVQIENDVLSPTRDLLKPISDPGTASGDTIDGYDWKQVDMYLRDSDATLFSDVSLPDSIDELNGFEEAFFTVTFDAGNSAVLFNADIDNIQAILSTMTITTDVQDELVEVLAASDVHNGAGAMSVQMPEGVSGTLEASYKQQAANELDGQSFNFAIPGDVYQLWDVHFTGEITDGELIEVILSYDDTYMTLADEFTLGVLHVLDDGSVDGLLQVVERNVEANTITVLTPGFSDLVAVSVPVPAPTTLSLIALGLAGIRYSRSRQKKEFVSDLADDGLVAA